MNQIAPLRPRLAATAALVGKGSVADIGSDHAWLPITLCLRGTPSALASDLNEGPCSNARANIAALGLDEKIKVVCRPGLDGIEDFAPDNIVIAGMGGELIADILSASEYPRLSRCLLILQPMTMQDKLRRYLFSAGFAIREERVVCDEKKYYQILSCCYDGKTRTAAHAELCYGKENLIRFRTSPTADDLGFLRTQKRILERKIAGRRQAVEAVAGLDDDLSLLALTEELLSGGNSHADCP